MEPPGWVERPSLGGGGDGSPKNQPRESVVSKGGWGGWKGDRADGGKVLHNAHCAIYNTLCTLQIAHLAQARTHVSQSAMLGTQFAHRACCTNGIMGLLWGDPKHVFTAQQYRFWCP